MKRTVGLTVLIAMLVVSTGSAVYAQTTIERLSLIGNIWVEPPPPELPWSLDLEGTADIEEGHQSDSDGDGKLVIPIEIIAMNLKSVAPVVVPATVKESPSKSSTGKVKQISPGIDFPAESFFDVFIEIELPGQTLHNEVPIRIRSEINSLPFYGALFEQELPGPVPLLNEFDEPAGTIEVLGLTFDEIPPTGVNTYWSTGAGLLALVSGLVLVAWRRRRSRIR